MIKCHNIHRMLENYIILLEVRSYICLGGETWVVLYDGLATQPDTSNFITRDELNTTLKKIEEEISKIRGK